MKLLRKSKIEALALHWGILTFVLLGVYFMIMKSLGLVHIIELRLFNGVIMFFGCYLAIRTAKQTISDLGYFKGLGVGLLTALIASASFAAFGFLYLTVLEPAFLDEIKANEPLALYMNPYLASIQIFIEGSASGVLFTFAIMQWLRKPYLAGGS